MNFGTAYLDGSGIYGATPESADKLREFDGGFLKVILVHYFSYRTVCCWNSCHIMSATTDAGMLLIMNAWTNHNYLHNFLINVMQQKMELIVCSSNMIIVICQLRDLTSTVVNP